MYSLLNGMCQSTGVISPNFESMHGGDSITPQNHNTRHTSACELKMKKK